MNIELMQYIKLQCAGLYCRRVIESQRRTEIPFICQTTKRASIAFGSWRNNHFEKWRSVICIHVLISMEKPRRLFNWFTALRCARKSVFSVKRVILFYLSGNYETSINRSLFSFCRCSSLLSPVMSCKHLLC